MCTFPGWPQPTRVGFTSRDADVRQLSIAAESKYCGLHRAGGAYDLIRKKRARTANRKLCFWLSALVMSGFFHHWFSVTCVCYIAGCCFSFLQTPSFYWEIELCSLGESAGQETGPSISVGLAPPTVASTSGWINSVGSCLLHRLLSRACSLLFVVYII